MIFAKPTKYKAGISLYGDYRDLSSLHSTVHQLADRIPLAGHFEEFIASFAYELRHAYQGDRETIEFGDEGFDRDTYFGCSILWPYHLLYVGFLRWAAAFNPTTKEIQGNLFLLESCTERALLEADPKVGSECIQWLSQFDGFPSNYLLAFIDDCCFDYITVETQGKRRFQSLPSTLRRLDPISNEYLAFEEQLQQISKFQKCSPHDLHNREEWPEFKW
ncbi:MAG TPA: hypothetical protein PKE66_08535 [Pyrinomonadaceae bacterium]|nr:hypothetical protein [Pyrinomonadaceae bacterium]